MTVLDPHVSTRGALGHVVLGMVAQMERRFIKERQRDGIERAKAVGIYVGGKRRLDRERIRVLHAEGAGPAAIARIVGCSRMQAYRVLQEGCEADVANGRVGWVSAVLLSDRRA
ncbi:DNA invertase Pin-like site-specific DNA recombinase [Methylobacterium sp. PvR107]|nr:DNA invertase Pin-like site-specific DNA recombinase [Methylobacterium sp. PvR107]